MGLIDETISFVRSLAQGFTPEPQEPEPERPEQGVWGSGDRDDYDTDRAIRRKSTPKRIGDALADADEGDTAAQYELFEEVERDPRVSRLYFRRRLAVVGKPLQITPANDTPEAQRAADLCNELVLGVDGQGGIKDFDDALYDLSDAIGKAFAAAQIVWDLDGGLWVPKRLKRWPQREFYLGDPLEHEDYDPDELRVITDTERTSGKPITDFAPGQWIVHQQRCWSQPLARAALFRAVTWYWLFKKFGMKDWSILLERFGIPPRIGKYGPGTSDDEQDDLWKAVRDMGKDHACIIPEATTIELLKETGGKTEVPHPKMVRHCNEEISVAIMGNTMTTEQGDRGARSAKEAFQTDEYEQAEFDAKRLAATIKAQLLEPIVRFNIGPKAPVPKCEFMLDDYDDLESRGRVDKVLVEMGVPLAIDYFYDAYDRPKPGEDEEVIEGGTPPAF
jgi:phage gp29-like protein